MTTFVKVEIVEPDALATRGKAAVEADALTEVRRRARNMGEVLDQVSVAWSRDDQWCTASAEGRPMSAVEVEAEVQRLASLHRTTPEVSLAEQGVGAG